MVVHLGVEKRELLGILRVQRSLTWGTTWVFIPEKTSENRVSVNENYQTI